MTPQTTLSPFKQLVQAAKARVQQTDVASVKQRINAGETFYLIDVREVDEFARGAIPGAIHLGKGIVERDINEVVPDQKTSIVLYCGGGSRSALAADNLQNMGYTHVQSMNGGYRGWLQASEEV